MKRNSMLVPIQSGTTTILCGYNWQQSVSDFMIFVIILRTISCLWNKNTKKSELILYYLVYVLFSFGSTRRNSDHFLLLHSTLCSVSAGVAGCFTLIRTSPEGPTTIFTWQQNVICIFNNLNLQLNFTWSFIT